jgi:hypothetical protein
MFAETKKRLQNRIGMSDKDFAKVKFSVILSREIDPRVVEEGAFKVHFNSQYAY